MQTSDNATASTSYYGNNYTATDQAGNSIEYWVDGLGRTVRRESESGGLGYQTWYGYDALGD